MGAFFLRIGSAVNHRVTSPILGLCRYMTGALPSLDGAPEGSREAQAAGVA